jgi:hypothetical protein
VHSFLLPFDCQLPKSFRGNCNVSLWRLPGFFRRRMQHIDGFGKFGDIEDAMGRSDIYPNFIHSETDSRHRLPISGIQPLLDPTQFVADSGAGVRRKIPYDRETVRKPNDGLHSVIILVSVYLARSEMSLLLVPWLDWRRAGGGLAVCRPRGGRVVAGKKGKNKKNKRVRPAVCINAHVRDLTEDGVPHRR